MAKEHLIVCIDDDRDDIDMLRDAFRRLPEPFRIVEAYDGKEGLALIRRLHAEGRPPCLIVLDINMPLMDGRETFLAIQREPELNESSIVIFSTSNSPLDRLFFEHKNATYFVKPVNFDALIEVAGQLLGLCAHNRKMSGVGGI